MSYDTCNSNDKDPGGPQPGELTDTPNSDYRTATLWLIVGLVFAVVGAAIFGYSYGEEHQRLAQIKQEYRNACIALSGIPLNDECVADARHVEALQHQVTELYQRQWNPATETSRPAFSVALPPATIGEWWFFTVTGVDGNGDDTKVSCQGPRCKDTLQPVQSVIGY